MSWLIALLVIVVAVAVGAVVVIFSARRVMALQAQLNQAQLALEGANNRLEQAKSRLALLSNTDPVTGLLVRHVVVERFQLSLALARSEGVMFGIVVLQLSDFESQADRHGRDIANKLLVGVAERLRATVTETETVGRVREQEFAVLIPILHDIGEIDTIATQLREALLPPFKVSGNLQTFSLAVHSGSAVYPRDGEDWPSMLKTVDERLRSNRILLH